MLKILKLGQNAQMLKYGNLVLCYDFVNFSFVKSKGFVFAEISRLSGVCMNENYVFVNNIF